MSHLSARAAGLVLALGALSLTGCKSTQERLHDILVDGFQTEPSWATSICNYEAQGLTGVSVTAVTNNGSSNNGSGTATVTGTPIMMAGMTAPGPCSGTIAFTYSTVRTGTRVTYSSRGRRRSSATYSMQVDGITVTSRTGTAAAMPGQMPGVMPAAMGGQMPAAAGAGQCAAYARCCASISTMPQFQGMAATCSQVAQLSALGPQGEMACAQTLAGVRQSLTAMGNMPAGCQ